MRDLSRGGKKPSDAPAKSNDSPRERDAVNVRLPNLAPAPPVTPPPAAPVGKAQRPDMPLGAIPGGAEALAEKAAAEQRRSRPSSGPLSAKSRGTGRPPATTDSGSGEAAPPRSGGGGMASRIAGRMGANSSGARVVPNRPGAAAPVRREGNLGGNIRSLDRGGRTADGAAAKKGDGKGKRPEPRIKLNLASMPDAPATPAANPSSGPAQKPEIRLTREVIDGQKKGMKASLQQLEKDQEQKKRAAAKTGGLAGFTAGKAGYEEEDKLRKKKLSGLATARPDRSRGGRRGARMDLDRPRRGRQTLRRKGTNTAAPRKDKVQLELPATVRSFCEAAGVSLAQVMKVCMSHGMMVNINANLDFETAELLAAELDLDIELKDHETLEDELITEIEDREDDEEHLQPRPPIVTFLGHVDHGKTSLLDRLMGVDVAGGEAGGITQHIRAYEVTADDRKITFVDTPGHEAFTEMRARGANVTDIAVLVIAADDGIMPQTAEAIAHAKAAEVPIVVALNKIDLEGIDRNRVMTQMTEHGLTPSEWGGDVEVVGTSAMTGEGMDDLLDTLLTVAELHEYVANPQRAALGVCLEASQDGDRGVTTKLIVLNGTLRIGDVLVCGPAHGRVRAMSDPLTGAILKEAGPSTPVSLIGLSEPPGAGDRFHVLDDIGQAREIAARRSQEDSRLALSGITTKVSFVNFSEMLEDGTLGHREEPTRLNLIIRSDARGSLEAIQNELNKFDHPEVELRVLQRSVGGVTLADVTLASASDAVILAFNVVPNEKARSMAEDRGVEIRRYSIIYQLTDDIKQMIEGRLKPEERVIELGRALVKQTFAVSKLGNIAGCYVMQGKIERGCRIRVTRDGRVIGEYDLDSLRRIKEDVKEVPRGMECGIRIKNFGDVKQDDVLEAYRVEQVARKLE